MKVNWGALDITIGLILVAASILAVGLMVGKRISRLEKEVPIIRAGIKRTVIAEEYAFSKAESESPQQFDGDSSKLYPDPSFLAR